MEGGKERFHRRCISRHEGEGKRRTRDSQRGGGGCLFYRAFTLHLGLSGMSRHRQGELVSYKILFYMKQERLA